MGALSPAVQEQMRKKAEALKKQMSGSGGFIKRWDLVGKNAIVQPGSSAIARLLPRWDRYTRGADGKLAENPAAVDQPIFFDAFEHWWDAPDGKKTREWCPKTFGPEAPCPICEAAEELASAGDKESKESANRIKRKEAFLFNAMIGATGSRKFTEDGKPDIRYMAAPNTVFVGISDVMTGGTEPQFGRGDISDPRDGFDLKLARPASGGNDRWKVDAAVASPLMLEAEKAQYRGWSQMLVDLPKMVESESKTYDELYKLFHGVSAPGEREPGDEAASGVEDDDIPPATSTPGVAVGGAAEDPLDGLDDVDAGIDLPPAAPPKPAAKAAAKPQAAGRRK